MYYLVEFCRLCLSSTGEFTVMWLDDIMDKVTACISELEFDSNLPLLICNACLEKVDDFFRFRNQCLQSEFFLSSYIEKLIEGTQSYAKSTLLNVNLIKDFGTSNGHESNVNVHKTSYSSSDVQPDKLNVNFRDFSEQLQNASNTSDKIDIRPVPVQSIASKKNTWLRELEDDNYEGSFHLNSVDSDNISKSDISVASEITSLSNSVKAEQHDIITAKDIVDESDVVKHLEINSSSSDLHKKSNILPNICEVNILNEHDDMDDVFIEEEDEYCTYEPPSPPTVKHPEQIMLDNTKGKEIINLGVQDPENLLIHKGKARVIHDVQTDVSERVKLRKRNTKVEPVYRSFSRIQKDVAKKYSPGGKKILTRKAISNPDQIEQSNAVNQKSETVTPRVSKGRNSVARKSTSKQRLSNPKHNKFRITSTNYQLWVDACRELALLNMQAFVTDADFDCQNSNDDSMSNENTTFANSTNDGSLISEDPEQNAAISLNKTSKKPHIKTTQELNSSFQGQHQRRSEFSDQDNNVVKEENIAEDDETSKSTSDREHIQVPRILNTFTLNDDNIWNPLRTNNNETEEDLQTSSNTMNSDLRYKDINIDHSYSASSRQNLSNAENENSIIGKKIALAKSILKSNYSKSLAGKVKTPSRDKIKTSKKFIKINPGEGFQPTQQINDNLESNYEDAHFFEDSRQSVPLPSFAKMPKEPSKSMQKSRKQTNYKIKTTNNISLIDPDQKSSDTSTEEENRLNQLNLENILNHHVKHSPLPNGIRPLKILVPRNYSPSHSNLQLTMKNGNWSFTSPAPSTHTFTDKMPSQLCNEKLLYKDSASADLSPTNFPKQPKLQKKRPLFNDRLTEKIVEDILNTENATRKYLGFFSCEIKNTRSSFESTNAEKHDNDVILIEDSPSSSNSSNVEEHDHLNRFTAISEKSPEATTSRKVSARTKNIQVSSHSASKKSTSAALKSGKTKLRIKTPRFLNNSLSHPLASRKRVSSQNQVIEQVPSISDGLYIKKRSNYDNTFNFNLPSTEVTSKVVSKTHTMSQQSIEPAFKSLVEYYSLSDCDNLPIDVVGISDDDSSFFSD